MKYLIILLLLLTACNDKAEQRFKELTISLNSCQDERVQDSIKLANMASIWGACINLEQGKLKTCKPGYRATRFCDGESWGTECMFEGSYTIKEMEGYKIK